MTHFEDGDDHELIEAWRDAFRYTNPGGTERIWARIECGRTTAPAPISDGVRLYPRSRRWWDRWIAIPVAIALTALLCFAVAVAASGILNLGKPTASLPPNSYFQLSGFTRIPQTVRSHGRAEILVISDSAYVNSLFGSSADERFPIVKALDQFGTLSGTVPIDRPSWNFKFQGREIPQQDISTIDWNGARFSSRYVTFVHKDLTRFDPSTDTNKPYQKLGPIEERLYKRYAKVPKNSLPGGPLIVIGDYEQYVSQIPLDGDFRGLPGPQNQPGQPGPPLSFATIQTALMTGKDPPQSTLVEDTNAEANVITTLICHADGGKPGSVCSRPVIKKLLKHVR